MTEVRLTDAQWSVRCRFDDRTRYRVSMEGKPLSPQEMRALVVYARHGSQKVAAEQMGIGAQTIKNHLGSAYRKLGTSGIVETYRRLGWLRVPGDE